MDNSPCALVVGLCSHGLAIARALHARGIEVHAFEANPTIPGFLTNSAVVHRVDSIKQESLVVDLLAFRQHIQMPRKIVLFATNDNNVRVIAENIDGLRGKFVLSWEHCTSSILALLLKSNIERRCLECGLLYPKSVVADTVQLLPQLISGLKAPYIVKPIRPQSGFKAFRFNDADTLFESMEAYADDFPVIVQEWIAGTAEDLYFCALYLDRGKVLHSFVGRKLESYPPALGQTTVAISYQDHEVERLAIRFFADLDISGPVSLELKKDQRGNYWVIEPTVGRTDFWLGLCIAGGADLPLIEYQHSIGCKIELDVDRPETAIWFDSERDTMAPIRYLHKWLNFSVKRYSPVFSYSHPTDIKPFFRASAQAFDRIWRSMQSKMKNQTGDQSKSTKSLQVNAFQSFDELPIRFRNLLEINAQDYIFFDPEWFKNFHDQVAGAAGKVEILCLGDGSGAALAILPLWLHEEKFHGINLRKITGLANYYTPRFEIFFDEKLCNRSTAISIFFDHLKNQHREWDVIEFYPMQRECVEDILPASTVSFPYYITENYVQTISSSFSDYLLSRPSRHRNTIRRKYNRLERLPDYQFDISLGGSHIADIMANYHDVYMQSWKIDEPFPGFIDGLVKLASNRGWLRLGRLLIDGQVVASQIWFVANDTAFIYKLAYDRNFSEYSPGTLLTCEMLRHVIDKDHVKCIDFLHGADAFKKDWMDASSSLYGIQFPNPYSARGALLIALNTLSTWKEKWLKQRDWFEPAVDTRKISKSL